MASPALSKAVAGIQTVLVHFQAVAAGVANRATFRLPQKSKILRVAASVRASDATDLQVMAEADGANLLTGAIDVIPLAAPTAPTAALADPAAPGNVNDGTHSYKLTFVNAVGESAGSAKSNVVTVADKATNGQIVVTIGTGPSGTVARKLYRTSAGDAGAWKLVATVANNTATTVTDNLADGAGASVPTKDTRSEGEYFEGVLATAANAVAKEAAITVDVDTLTGTDVKDLCVQIDLCRLD